MIDHGQSRTGELRIIPDSNDDPVLDEDRPVPDVKVIVVRLCRIGVDYQDASK